jgi:predicted metal-dependent hydrolase
VETNPALLVTTNLKRGMVNLLKYNSINLNVNLMKTPEETIDYIIIHELCHSNINEHTYQI